MLTHLHLEDHLFCLLHYTHGFIASSFLQFVSGHYVTCLYCFLNFYLFLHYLCCINFAFLAIALLQIFLKCETHLDVHVFCNEQST